jgi:hypothetical protein
METEAPSPDDLPDEIDTDDLPDEPAEGEDSGSIVEDADES